MQFYITLDERLSNAVSVKAQPLYGTGQSQQNSDQYFTSYFIRFHCIDLLYIEIINDARVAQVTGGIHCRSLVGTSIMSLIKMSSHTTQLGDTRDTVTYVGSTSYIACAGRINHLVSYYWINSLHGLVCIQIQICQPNDKTHD